MARTRLLADQDALDAALRDSAARPVFVFKHSLICPISTRADVAFGDFVRARSDDDADFHRIEIQNARAVSDAVAERTGVQHESPQVLLFVDGDVVWHTSHGSITRDALDGALARTKAD